MEFINVATEDVLSEAVAIRLIKLTDGKLVVSQTLRKNGFGYLRKKFDNFCQLAEHSPVLLITDLDMLECAPKLVSQWSAGKKIPQQLLFRVAVREIESWILADHEGLKKFFGGKIGSISSNPDSLPNPKATLLTLAQKAPAKIRNGLVAKKGSLAIQGVEYNILLSDFVNSIWSPIKASERSESLARAIKSIRALADKVS